MMFMTVYFCYGQGERTVKGTVVDSAGPVPYATIKETAKSNVVTADALGNFTIAISSNQITITATGYSPQTVSVTGNSITVTLRREEAKLEEVVVTALGIRRSRNQVAYAAQQVSGDEVNRTRSNNFVQNLSGRIAGLDVKQTNTLGGSTNVILRGTKSITGDNQALFVVDGIPYSNSNTNSADQRRALGGYDYGNAAADINPDDIATVTVLKGAAASALYGAQGANGVILITTKKGKSGMGITINSSISMGKADKSTFTTYQKSYGAGYGAFYEDPTGYFLYRDIDGDGKEDLIVPVLEDASYGARFDPSLQVFHWDAFDPTSPNYKKTKPWVAGANDPSTFFETAWSSNQSIFLDGANERGTFKLGYTRTDDKGIMPNSSITKNLVNFGATYNITPKLIAGAVINYSNINGRGRYGTGYDTKNLMSNFRQWWQVNVDVSEQRDAYFRTKKNTTWNWKDPDNLVPNFWDNPYFTRYENYQNDTRNRYFGNINLNYKITDWLNILGRVSQDSYNEIQEERLAVGSVGVSSYSRFNRSFNENNYDLMATADRDISEDINIKGLLGGNIRRQHTSSIRAATNGGLIVPKIYALSNSLNTPNAPVEFDGIREVQGVFAGATFSWRDMLILDGTIRRDKSSTLPEGNNVYYYPSLAAGFVFSKLLTTTDWLTYGKLRANYAEVGNDAPIYSVNDVYTVVPPFGSNPQSSVSGTKNNPDLQPERTKSFEVGLEMAFFKNRLGFDLSYYDAKSIDQILPVIVSTATGYNSKFLNAGTVQNKGVELTVFATPVLSKNFSWNININYARNRNKVVKLFEGATNLVLADFQGGVSLNATLGEPYGTIRGSNFVFTENASKTGSEKTVNQANGRYYISPTANEIIGNANPDWQGGINNAFKYKNLTFSFLIDTRQGGDIFSLDMHYGLGTGIYPENVELNDLGNPSRNSIANGGGIILPGVDPAGQPNTKRRNNSEGTLGYRQPTAGFIYDASFVKLREITLSYSLPAKMIAGMKYFKGIEFTLAGRNLWVIDKNLPYSDPEDSASAGNLQGYQGGSYPNARIITFNVKIRF